MPVPSSGSQRRRGANRPRWAASSLEILHPPDRPEVLLVLDGIGQRSHHLLLLQRQDAQALHQACQSIAAPLRSACLSDSSSCCISLWILTPRPPLMAGTEGVASATGHGLLDLGERLPVSAKAQPWPVPGGHAVPRRFPHPSAHKEHQEGRRGATITSVACAPGCMLHLWHTKASAVMRLLLV